MWRRFGQSKLVSGWLIVTVVASVIAFVDGGWLARHTAFSPARIWSGEVWRLGTWLFVQRSPMGVFLTAVAIYKLGGELAVRWGDRRLRTFMIEVVGVAAVATAMLAFVFSGAMWLSRHGGTVAVDVLVIAWAKQFPAAELRFAYGMLTLSGKRLIAVVVGLNVLFALAYGIFELAPELIACGAAYWYPAARLRASGR